MSSKRENPKRIWSSYLATSTNPKAAHAEYLHSAEWAKLRDLALTRADSRCQVCNAEDKLQVHHRTYERWGAEEPGDLTVLCARCHRRFHGNGKGKNRRHRQNRPTGGISQAEKDLVLKTLGSRALSTKKLGALIDTPTARVGNVLRVLLLDGRVKQNGKGWRCS